jgi:hypothetical protein
MRFDPVADPWGTAMLAAGALWLLSLLVMLAASLAGTSRRTGGHMMLASLLVFLGASVGGTWVRIQQGEELATLPTPAPAEPVVVDASVEGSGDGGAGRVDLPGETGGSTGGPGDDGTTERATAGGTTGGTDAGSGGGSTGGPQDPSTGASTGEPASASTGSDPDTGGGSTGEPEPGEPEPGEPEPGEPEPSTPPPEPVVPENLPQVDPLPTDPLRREVAIRDILEDAARAAGGGERCGNLERVAEAWARLQLVPVTRKAKSIAADLERCRRRLLYSISQKRLREMVMARDAWFEKLPTKLRKQHGLVVQAAISGSSDQRLRIGNRQLDATRADEVMEAGLREELLRLQFAHVVLSNGKTSKTYELPVTPEGELGMPWLRAVGLGEPLRLAGE